MSRKCWCCAVAVVTLHNNNDVGWLWMSWCQSSEAFPQCQVNHVQFNIVLWIITLLNFEYANPISWPYLPQLHIYSMVIQSYPLLSLFIHCCLTFSWHIIDAKHPALIMFNCETAQSNPLLASWLIIFWRIQLSITIIIHPFLIGCAAIYP